MEFKNRQLLLILLLSFSGGHFNPAVTVASILCGGTRLIVGLIYLPVQFIGAILGSAFVKVQRFIISNLHLFPR